MTTKRTYALLQLALDEFKKTGPSRYSSVEDIELFEKIEKYLDESFEEKVTK